MVLTCKDLNHHHIKFKQKHNYILTDHRWLALLQQPYTALTPHIKSPILPTLSLVSSRKALHHNVTFKYIWGWKRDKQSYIFNSDMGSLC